jgi:hypothetical protein
VDVGGFLGILAASQGDIIASVAKIRLHCQIMSLLRLTKMVRRKMRSDQMAEVNPLQVAVGTSALLDKLIVKLVDKGLLTKSDCSEILLAAITDIQSSPDPEIQKGAAFLKQMYPKG